MIELYTVLGVKGLQKEDKVRLQTLAVQQKRERSVQYLSDPTDYGRQIRSVFCDAERVVSSL